MSQIIDWSLRNKYDSSKSSHPPEAIFFPLQPFSAVPNEILLQIFSYLNISSICQASLVNKQWNVLTRNKTLYYYHAIKSLVQCSHPLKIPNKRTLEIKGVYPHLYALDTCNHQIICGYGINQLYTYDLLTEKIKQLNLGYQAGSFAGYSNGKIHIGTNHGIEYYDDNNATRTNLGDVLNARPASDHLYTQSVDKKRIAFTGLTSDSIKIYNSETKSTIEIFDHRQGQSRYCQGIVFAGDSLIAAYNVLVGNARTGKDKDYMSSYNSKGELLATRQCDYRPYKITADENNVAVFLNDFCVIHQVKILDAHTLKEKYDLTSKIRWRDEEKILHFFQIFTLYEGKLYTLTQCGIFKVFDVQTGEIIREFQRADGTFFSMSHNHCISIQGTIIALGISFHDSSPINPCKVELWSLETGKLIKSFLTIDIPQKIKLELGDQPQLTVGIRGGIVQIWNLEIEQKHIKKNKIEK
jgi:hypothetical protein